MAHMFRLQRESVTSLLLLLVCPASTLASVLYVSDQTLNTVQVFDAASGALTGSLTPTDGWGSPSGIAVGADGDVYVADFNNNAIDKFSASGTFLGTFISSGLNGPTGLAFGPGGDLYVANFGSGGNSYVAQFDSGGNAVNLSLVPSSTGLFDPEAIAFGPDGNLYIADSSNGAVDQVLLPSGAFNTLIPAGCPSTPFANPQGVVFAASGNLYISDAGFGCGGSTDYGVYEYNTAGNLLETFVATNLLSTPIDLAFGPDGNLYVTDASGVEQFNGMTGTQIADFIPTGGLDGPLENPTFLAFSNSVPEPATLSLIGLALVGLTLRRLRQRWL
jgi:DNA-binding beta-propeller fold protein YncE